MNHKVKAIKHSELGNKIIFALDNAFFATRQYLIYDRSTGSCLMSDAVHENEDGTVSIAVNPDDFLSGASDDLLMELPDIDDNDEILDKK